MQSMVRIWENRRILRLLVQRDLRVRYAASFLGYLWTIIDPLANALVYFMVFVVIMGRKDAGHAPYFLFLLAGLLPWQWYNATIGESPRALLSERQLVRSTSLPREIWVVRLVASKGLEFIFALPVLFVFAGIYVWRGEAHLDKELLYIPVAIVLQFILMTGIGMILAPLNILVTDIVPMVRIYLRIYFYLTPIIFNLELLAKGRVPPILTWLFQMNPLTGILELYRAGFFTASVRWHVVLMGVIGSVLSFALGWVVFRRLEPVALKEI